MQFITILSSCFVLAYCADNKLPKPGYQFHTIVHLFEWKWTAIADECENFLQFHGYGGVQISPPSENLVIANRPWWERYQVVSYILGTRSGNENEFADMVARCNAVGVNIYVDTVINHMTAGDGTGTAGSVADNTNGHYPAVPYVADDFHSNCEINNYQNAENVRNCRLNNLIDLAQNRNDVREAIIGYMNHLLGLGVAGFRIDAAKHMWPDDLNYIYRSLNNLSTSAGFKANTPPFVYQEVIDLGGEAITAKEYIDIARVLEFKYGNELGRVFQRNDKLTYLVNWGEGWNLLPSDDAVAFIDNHDNQRTGNNNILTYKNSKPYKMAIAFMLAFPYGVTRIISSYDFTNKDAGPPADSEGNLISPGFNPDNTCTNGYVCEHRWREIYNMAYFRTVVGNATLKEWWSDGNQQIAFCRGDRGFVAFTNDGDIDRNLQTCLPEGTYCDVISGNLIDNKCTGKSVSVNNDGNGHIVLCASEEDGVLALHINAKII